MSALELAECYRRRECSSVELTRFFLERIERLDPQLNAFVTVLRRRALATAHWRDRVRSDAVFAGVPTGLKDLVPMFGTPTKLGSRAYRWFVSPFSARAATRIQRGGFVVLGKLATSEFGVLPIVEPRIHPPTRNPWNTDHTSGGSSGGTAAAVAARLLPIAQGSDGGGSVRIPSALCHLFGFKPSIGLLGNLHGRVNNLGMSVMGPLAHNVEDAAAWLDVLRGDYHPHRDRDERTCLQRCRRPPKPLRIRFAERSPLGHRDPELLEPTLATAKLLESLGHHVEPAPEGSGTLDEFMPLYQYMLSRVPAPGDGKLEPVTRWLREAGRKLDYDFVRQRQRELTDRLAAVYGDADVMVSPTVPVHTPRIGQFAGLPPDELFRAVVGMGSLTAPMNISTWPAANIPAAISSKGLPIGVQIGARGERDHLLLSLAKQLEEAMPWQQRHAPAVC